MQIKEKPDYSVGALPWASTCAYKKFIVIDSNDDPFEVILKTISNNI